MLFRNYKEYLYLNDAIKIQPYGTLHKPELLRISLFISAKSKSYETLVRLGLLQLVSKL